MDPANPPAVRTTTTTTSTIANESIRFDGTYLKTAGGLLKIAQTVVNFIAMVCIASTDYWWWYRSRKTWFLFVSVTALIFTLSLLILYLIHMIERMHKVPWLIAEMAYCVIWCICYFIASLLIVLKYHWQTAWPVGGVFGFLAMFLYGVDAVLKYKAWRSGAIAQGQRIVTITQTYPPY